MDNVTFEELNHSHSGSRMLKSDESSKFLGLMTSIYLVTSIGSEVCPLSSHKIGRQNCIGKRQSKHFGEVPHFMDLDFVEDMEDPEAWFPSTSAFKKQSEYYNTIAPRNLTDYESNNHNEKSIRRGNETSEDVNYLWESALFLPAYQPFMKPKQAPEAISTIWNGSVVEKKRLSRTFPQDLDSLSDSVVSDEPILIDTIASSSDSSSPTISNCISDQVHETGKLTSELASNHMAISLEVEDSYSPTTEDSPSSGVEKDSSVNGVNEEAPTVENLLHESDKDRESQNVAELE